jgi:hypothetical protein
MKSSYKKGKSKNASSLSGETSEGIIRSAVAGPNAKRKRAKDIDDADVIARELKVHSKLSNTEPAAVALSGSIHVTLIMQY